MQEWGASTPRVSVLRLYKFLNLSGYSVLGIDAAFEREAKRGRLRPLTRNPKRRSREIPRREAGVADHRLEEEIRIGGTDCLTRQVVS